MTVATQTVRDIALENPATIRVFEAFGIDYCCGGRKPLSEACAVKNLSVDAVIEALENTCSAPEREIENWSSQSLGVCQKRAATPYGAGRKSCPPTRRHQAGTTRNPIKAHRIERGTAAALRKGRASALPIHNQV